MSHTPEEAVSYATWWVRDVLEPKEPVYLIRRAEAPHLFHQWATVAVAHTVSTQRSDVRSFLDAAGRWRGHGFACVIDLGRLRESVLLADCRDLLLHEYGHHLLIAERPAPDAPSDLPAADAAEVESYRGLYDLATTTTCPWFNHEADFVRIMLHCWHRSWVRRRPLEARNVWAAGPAYGLAPIGDYLRVLWPTGDLQRHERTPLEEIAQTPIPLVFEDFSQADCERYKQAHHDEFSR